MAVGIDLVHTTRITNPERLAKKILSEREYLIFEKRDHKEQFIAGRFAAKEAFMKALGYGLGTIPLNTIEILYRGENKGPYVLYQNVEYDVSISHDGEYAIAIVSI